MDIDTNAELIQDFYYLPEDLEDYLGRVVAADQIKDLKTPVFKKGTQGEYCEEEEVFYLEDGRMATIEKQYIKFLK